MKFVIKDFKLLPIQILKRYNSGLFLAVKECYIELFCKFYRNIVITFFYHSVKLTVN